MNLPVFEFTHDDKRYKIYYHGTVEVTPIEPELKGAKIIINRLPQLVATKLERNSK